MKFILGILFISILLLSSNAFADSRLDNCEQYKSQIISILENEGVSSDYFYLAVCESGCKIKESNKGAHGFFQVTYPTYITYMPDGCGKSDIDDITCNVTAAARYIKHLKKRFSDIKTLVKAYNRGGTNLLRYGSTKEADGLSYCVLNYIKSDST